MGNCEEETCPCPSDCDNRGSTNWDTEYMFHSPYEDAEYTEEDGTSFREFGESLTAVQKQWLKSAHEKYGFLCSAHDEGQNCCVDYILEEENSESK